MSEATKTPDDDPTPDERAEARADIFSGVARLVRGNVDLIHAAAWRADVLLSTDRDRKRGAR